MTKLDTMLSEARHLESLVVALKERTLKLQGQLDEAINRALLAVPAWAPEHGGDIEQAVKGLVGLAVALKERIQELEGQLDDARAHLAVERGKARKIAEQAIAHGAVHQSFENKGGCGTCVYLKHYPELRCKQVGFCMSESEATAPLPPVGCLHGPAQIRFVKPRASVMERCDGAVFAGPMTPGMELERQHVESMGMQPEAEPSAEPECSIIGGMRGWEGGAAFVRVPMLVCRPNGRYIVRGSQEELITEEEYRGVLESGEALELPQPWPFRPDRELWLLRKNFPHHQWFLSHLKRQGALRYVTVGEGGAVLVCVDAQKVDGLRERTASRQRSRALLLRKEGRFQEALEAAELAVDLETRPTPEKIALVVELYKRLGDPERADAYLEMVLNSYGAKFYDRANREVEWLERCTTAICQVCTREVNARRDRGGRFRILSHSGLNARDCCPGTDSQMPEPEPEPEPEPKYEERNAMVRIEGKVFRCDCGANVFTRRGNRYFCNSCESAYIGEK